MALLYKASHPLGHVVALKVMPPARAANARALARFLREGRLTLRLKHPNVVRTIHAGKSDELHFIALEHLEGETLEAVLKRHPSLPSAEAVRIVFLALLGLRHIHEQGVIHRNLSPAHLMLVPAPSLSATGSTLASEVKIIDFGLCRPLKEEAPPPGKDGDHLTRLGTWLGTPDYLAPEQARDARSAGVQADIYSLGCVLYHCLTGEPPFGDGPPGRLLKRQLAEAPRPLRELNPNVAEELQQVVVGMLAKGLDYRFPSAERVAESLRPFLPPLAVVTDPTAIFAPLAQVVLPMPVETEQAAPEAVPAVAVPEAPNAVPARRWFTVDRRNVFFLGTGAALGAGLMFLFQLIGWWKIFLAVFAVFAARYLFRYLFRKARAAFVGEPTPPKAIPVPPEPVAVAVPVAEEVSA
jgi:serine/threonine protein kinase